MPLQQCAWDSKAGHWPPETELMSVHLSPDSACACQVAQTKIPMCSAGVSPLSSTSNERGGREPNGDHARPRSMYEGPRGPLEASGHP
eukprot:278728-Pyramimonas_sp.AAC.1